MNARIPVTLMATITLPLQLLAQTASFTYQGRLAENAAPANGVYDLTFSIFDIPAAGSALATPVATNGVPVSNGLFTVQLDFGPAVFDGGARWLQIAVKTNGAAGPSIDLVPRQSIASSPYAIRARESGNSMAVAPGAVGLSGLQNSSVNSDKIVDGSITTDDLAGSLLSGTFWRLQGNTGTTPAHFVGTTDNQPLQFRVNGNHALRLEPTPDTPNIVGGYSGNGVRGGLAGVTIGGGGTAFLFGGLPQPNSVSNNGQYATIAGGYNNTVTNYGGAVLGGAVHLVGGSFSGIGAGQFHKALGDFTWVGGGFSNVVGSPFATVGGGGHNRIGTNSNSGVISGGYGHNIRDASFDGTISGGSFNTIGTNSWYSTIGGGSGNVIASNQIDNATIGGGSQNFAGGLSSTIGGGFQNRTLETDTTVGGGYLNIASGYRSTIGGGTGNRASGIISTIAGGDGNAATNVGTVVSGGAGNLAGGFLAMVGGGQGNAAAANNSTIVGGLFNTNNGVIGFLGGGYWNLVAGAGSMLGGGGSNSISAQYATIAGGELNVANIGSHTAIGGGSQNSAFGSYAAVPGGYQNLAGMPFSLAAGNRAKATHTGAFVWADSTPADFSSTAVDQFNVRASGGVRIQTGGAGMTIDGLPVPSGSGPGSGLNADLLDGLNSTAFALAAHNHYGETWSGSATRGLSVSTTSPGPGAAGLHGRNGTSASFGTSSGVWGESGSGFGVLGTSSGIAGVNGYAAAASGITYGVIGESSSTSGRGVLGVASALSGFTYGLYGYADSPDGIGVFGKHEATTGTAAGVQGDTDSTSVSAVGVLGRVTSTSPGGSSVGVRGINNGTGLFGIGVFGSHAGGGWGVNGTSVSGDAVRGQSTSGVGVRGISSSDVGVYAQSTSGNIIEAWSSGGGRRFLVQNDGNVRADGTFASPAADFAELLPGSSDLEPGDVLVVDERGRLARSSEPGQESVVGIYSTRPAFLGGADEEGVPSDKVPLAVVGVVPVKVTNENGPIKPGNLLVSSSLAGHAMKAASEPRVGTILGKALAPFDGRTGVIQMLVVLQ